MVISVDKAVIARIKSHGQTFEILVDCDNAIALKEGRDIPLKDIAASMHVYADSKKGVIVKEGALNQVFGTTNAEEVIRKIIEKGEIQLTQEYREKIKERKRKQLIDIIHRNGVDPKTHSPHPPQRIINALEEAKFHIDEFSDVNRQVQDALKKLRLILPIKFEIKEISVKISPEYAPKCYSLLRGFGALQKEEWLPSGYYAAVIEIPGGLEGEFYEKLNKITHGNMETKLIKTR